jgi:glutamine synthetase
MHVHQLLFKGNKKTFFDEDNPYYLSKTAKHYTAGLPRYTPEITAVVRPTG